MQLCTTNNGALDDGVTLVPNSPYRSQSKAVTEFHYRDTGHSRKVIMAVRAVIPKGLQTTNEKKRDQKSKTMFILPDLIAFPGLHMVKIYFPSHMFVKHHGAWRVQHYTRKLFKDTSHNHIHLYYSQFSMVFLQSMYVLTPNSKL